MTITEEQHEALRSLLGAWALGACPRREAAELEQHLRGCPGCAEEAARLRDAAGWLSADEPLDQPASLRQQVLDWCLTRRPAELPVPAWGVPYTAETAKLDALLRDLGPEEWQEVAELPWHGGTEYLRPAEVLCHLAAVDGYVALALGLPDPVPGGGATADRRVPPQDAAPPLPRVPRQSGPPWAGITERTARLTAEQAGQPPQRVRARWRRHCHELVRTAALAPQGNTPVDFGFVTVPLRDAFVDRAFECYVHGEDVARAVAYPYAPPAPQHLRQMVDLAVRMLPAALAGLRASRPEHAGTPAGGPPDGTARTGRQIRLVIDGPAAGEWLIPLDGPECGPPGGEPVAAMVLDGLEFCQLAAAHRDPDRVPVGEHGDRAAIREVLRAAPLLSRP